MTNAARAQLNFFAEELQELRKKFFAKLAAIFLSHDGQPVLIIRRDVVAGGYGTETLRTHFYMGILSCQAGDLFSGSGDVCIPTSHFVDCPDYFPNIDRLQHKKGVISQEVLGGNFSRQYFQKVRDDFGLTLHIGTVAVGQWLYEVKGLYPYVRKAFSQALDYPLPMGEKPSLQLVARHG
ncbi:MAG: hypothetical protein Q8Q10_02940 [bacterium]|nr:hypothetical protein [bacterium]